MSAPRPEGAGGRPALHDRAAERRWADLLGAWAIPEELVRAVPAPPYFFDPAVFAAGADEALAREDDTPSDRRAREALGGGGTVLDVGAGAGAGSLRLRPSMLVAVDTSAALLRALAERAARLAVPTTLIEGRWPDVAARAPHADVVVCHHVVYNVADLAPFAEALDDHALRRVVIELSAVHPTAWMAPYWAALHGLPTPEGPTVDDAVAVLRGLGFEVHDERWRRPLHLVGGAGPDGLANLARRLCLPRERHEELRALLRAVPPPEHRDVATLWWDRVGPAGR